MSFLGYQQCPVRKELQAPRYPPRQSVRCKRRPPPWITLLGLGSGSLPCVRANLAVVVPVRKVGVASINDTVVVVRGLH